MNKVLAFALLVSGLLIAGPASAQMGTDTTGAPSNLGTSQPVKVGVVSRSGDSVTLYAPEGNNVLCKGDAIPVYSSSGTVGGPAGTWSAPYGVEKTLPWTEDWSLFGQAPSGSQPFANERRREAEKMTAEAPPAYIQSTISSADINTLPMIGEVRVEKLVGDNYAKGTIVVGDARTGDVASKPSAQCLPEPGTQMTPGAAPEMTPEVSPQG